jgi:hypothetical protein
VQDAEFLFKRLCTKITRSCFAQKVGTDKRPELVLEAPTPFLLAVVPHLLLVGAHVTARALRSLYPSLVCSDVGTTAALALRNCIEGGAILL